ncbi:hypothetical protein ABIB54_000716 [Frigoribacterium sp. UYMn621]
MITFILVMGTLTAWAVIGSIVVGRRDGYRRQPGRPH